MVLELVEMEANRAHQPRLEDEASVNKTTRKAQVANKTGNVDTVSDVFKTVRTQTANLKNLFRYSLRALIGYYKVSQTLKSLRKENMHLAY